MAGSTDVVIISGCRTPIGKFQGSLSDLSAPQLGAIAVREAVSRANIDPQQVDECIMGNVVSAGLGQNPRARPHSSVDSSRSRCHDNQQSLRLRIESSRPRRASDRDRQ